MVSSTATLIIQNLSFLCIQINSFKYSKGLNNSIWPIDGTLTGNITPSHSGPWSNSNEGVLHIPWSSRTGAKPLDALLSYTGH